MWESDGSGLVRFGDNVYTVAFRKRAQLGN